MERLPADLWSCLHLTRLDLDLSHSAGLPPPVGSTNGAAFLPALRELRLARCRLQGGALPPALCQLSTLSRLEVFSCGLTSSAAHAGLPESVSRLSQLVSGWLCGAGAGFLWGPACAGLAALRTCASNLLPPGSASCLTRACSCLNSCNTHSLSVAGASGPGGQCAVHAAARAVHAASAAPPGPLLQPAGEGGRLCAPAWDCTSAELCRKV